MRNETLKAPKNAVMSLLGHSAQQAHDFPVGVSAKQLSVARGQLMDR